MCLPDYDESASEPWDGQQPAAPVEADGTPVYYRVPHDFAQAKNDGERWRWALAQAVEADPGLLNTARYEQANFLLEPVRHPDAWGNDAVRADGE